MAHRPNILKLATKISLESLTYTGITYEDPEYKILEPIVDDDMCEIMMHMRLEANRTAASGEDMCRALFLFTFVSLYAAMISAIIHNWILVCILVLPKTG